MLSPDSGKGSSAEVLCTPFQSFKPHVQGSSSKRSLFRSTEPTQSVDSDDETDMMGMSALPCSDSDDEVLSCNYSSNFQSLKEITRMARGSPKKLFIPLGKRCIQTPPPKLIENDEEFVPETPQSNGEEVDLVRETPQKSDSPVIRLITPLGSIKKDPSSVPRLNHRRKILLDDESNCDDNISVTSSCSSVKRHLPDDCETGGSATKIAKTEDASCAPKARTSLFQEKYLKPLDVDSFYGTRESQKVETKPTKAPLLIPAVKTRKSFSSSFNRKKRVGQINHGVGHGIRRPKPKKAPNKVPSPKIKKQNENIDKQNENVDENAKYKKTKFMKENPFAAKPNAVITINKRIKLNVVGKKIALPAKHLSVQPKKKPRLNVSLDATDLTVEDLEVEQFQENNPMKDLLQMLEDDWTEEEHEEVEEQVEDQTRNSFRFVEQTSSSDDKLLKTSCQMSPESELSNMTSVMNIEDNCANKEAADTMSGENADDKLFPIFRKGFAAETIETEAIKRRGLKRSWQPFGKNGISSDQYQLDLGQKVFGAVECKECGAIYNVKNPTDENLHLNYHNSFRTLTFSGWKDERIIHEDFGIRIILVKPNDPKAHWNKINQILKIVDLDLGLAEMDVNVYRDKTIYLYIQDKTIVGVLVAEHVESAYRMIPELLEYDCCAKESTPVKCGVNVVWTAMKYRRQKIATKLVDAMRRSFYYGYVLKMDEIAFSMPTPSGKIFAEKYTKSRDFKVYT